MPWGIKGSGAVYIICRAQGKMKMWGFFKNRRKKKKRKKTNRRKSDIEGINIENFSFFLWSLSQPVIMFLYCYLMSLPAPQSWGCFQGEHRPSQVSKGPIVGLSASACSPPAAGSPSRLPQHWYSLTWPETAKSSQGYLLPTACGQPQRIIISAPGHTLYLQQGWMRGLFYQVVRRTCRVVCK